MFTTSRARRHQQQQRGPSPPPGSDSCYGVRSLEGSVYSEATSRHRSDTVADVQDERNVGESTELPSQSIDMEKTPVIDSSSLPVSPAASMQSHAVADVEPLSDPITPPSPHDTLHPLDRGRNALDSRAELNHRLSLAHLPSPRTSAYHDISSVPSSPASVSFSCIASLSSVSRTSSPVSRTGYGSYGALGTEGEQGEDDLVLPTLSLPSSSLHMSLQRAIAGLGVSNGGLKVALVGDVDGLMDGLSERSGWELGRMGSEGGVGVLRDGKVIATIITGTIDTIQRRVNDGYAALDALLHPDLPMEKEEEVKKLIRDYATRNDWVHAVIVLESNDESATLLAEVAPTISSSHEADPFYNVHNLSPSTESRAPTPSPPRLGDDPTPMPSSEQAESYFAQPPKTSSDGGDRQEAAIDLIIKAIDGQATIVEASINKFIAWRGRNVRTPLHSSITSTTASSAGYAAQPMPTVARASGGGEWEANLSRRLAGAHARERERRSKGKPRRKEERDLEKAKRMERDRECGPIFPRGKGAKGGPQISRAGLSQLWENVFGDRGEHKSWLSWRWGWTMAAAVLVVGLGCWVKVR